MAPAGAVGVAGADGGAGVGPVVVGAADGTDGLGVGKVGSVGPVPGVAIGLPSMTELQPETNIGLASTAASTSEPPASPRRALCDNRTRCSLTIRIIRKQDYAGSYESYCGEARVDTQPMAQIYRCVTDSELF